MLESQWRILLGEVKSNSSAHTDWVEKKECQWDKLTTNLSWLLSSLSKEDHQTIKVPSPQVQGNTQAEWKAKKP